MLLGYSDKTSVLHGNAMIGDGMQASRHPMENVPTRY